VISPEWLEETGDPHDPDNPRVKALFENAREWAESWAGQGSVWGLRYDRDEAGSGVIDVFISPVHEQKQRKSDKTKKVISVNKSIQALFEMERVLDPMVKRPRGVLQSSWARRWCQDYLDPRIERGDYKEKTKRDHIHADILLDKEPQDRLKLLAETSHIVRRYVFEELPKIKVVEFAALFKTILEKI